MLLYMIRVPTPGKTVGNPKDSLIGNCGQDRCGNLAVVDGKICVHKSCYDPSAPGGAEQGTNILAWPPPESSIEHLLTTPHASRDNTLPAALNRLLLSSDATSTAAIIRV
jgi:hypothetical protein